jgi:hypothetical protein
MFEQCPILSGKIVLQKWTFSYKIDLNSLFD